jgi:hypothetical protein
MERLEKITAVQRMQNYIEGWGNNMCILETERLKLRKFSCEDSSMIKMKNLFGMIPMSMQF